MMRKWITWLVGLACVLLFVSPVMAEREGLIAIEQVVASGTTNPLYPAGYLVDGDYGTGWALTPGSTQGWAEVFLENEALIYGFELTGQLSQGLDVRIEYHKDGQWVPFTAPVLPQASLMQTIDLSYDRAVTDRLRLFLTSNGQANGILTELTVYGENLEPLYRRITPVTVSASVNTLAGYPVEFLYDDNTYTSWRALGNSSEKDANAAQELESVRKSLAESSNCPGTLAQLLQGTGKPAKPGDEVPALTAEVLFQLDQPYMLENIHIFFPADANGVVTVELAQGDLWQEVACIVANEQSGWKNIALADRLKAAVESDRVRFRVQGSGAFLGGISEVHFWGMGLYPVSPVVYLGAQEPVSIGETALNRYFELPGGMGQSYDLELGIREETSEPLTVEVNGRAITMEPAFTLRGQTIYRSQLTSGELWAGTNFVKILPGFKPLTLQTARLRQTNQDGAEDLLPGALSDGWLLTPVEELAAESELMLGQPALIEELRVYTGASNSFIYISAWVDGSWQPLTQTGWKGQWVQFAGPVLTDRIRISNLSGAPLSEVVVLGSVTTDAAPQVKILTPENNAILDFSGTDEDYLTGFVDQLGAEVLVNGKKVTRCGHFFWVRLSVLKDSPWERATLRATALDLAGRTGSDSIEVIWGERGLLVVDQPDELVYTNAATFLISGTARPPLSEVDVNGQTVTLTPPTGAFAVAVPLEDGFNLTRVQARLLQDQGEEKFITVQQRKVFRYSGTVQVEVNSPVAGLYTKKATQVVTGTVTGLGEVSVQVNGEPAAINGMFFTSAPVELVEGSNTITVEASDQYSTTKREIIIYKDTTSPQIVEVTPQSGLLFNAADVEVTGTIIDQSPVWLYINGLARVVAENTFQELLHFADGARQIRINAVDLSGNLAEHVIDLVVDTTPPEPFTVVADPAGWTNHTQPVIAFGTFDQTSGVDYYELAVDGGNVLIVTSPYQLSRQEDGVHEVAVTAVDRAGWRRTATTEIYIDTTPPETPQQLRVIPGDDNAIIKWDASTSADVIEYRVCREHQGAYETFNVTGTEFADANLMTGGTYSYQVWALDRAYNESAPTDWQEGTIGLAVAPYVPGEGAVVEYEGVTLVIPKTGLPEGIAEIRVTEVTSEVLEEKSIYPLIGPIYEFAAYREGSEVPEDVLPLEQGYLGSIHYDESLVPEGFPEQNLGVYHYDPMFDRWFLIPSAGVDVENNVIYFLTNHFSSFSVQATVMQDLTPQEYKDAGYSPLKTYAVHEGVAVSPQGGTASTQVTELVLPGRNGFDFVLSRRYDTATARSDAFSLAINGSIGFNLLSPSGELLQLEEILETVEGIQSAGDWANGQIAANIRAIIEEYLFNQGDYAYSMGQGWRLNIPYIKAANSSVMLCLADGTMHSINEMELVDVPEMHATFRVLELEQHEGADFTLRVKQTKSVDVVSALVGGDFMKTRWYGLGYELILKDGTTYELDALGRTVKMTDPTGLNTIKFEYSGLKLNYIEDTVGRRIRFAYDTTLLWPRINRIWVENDPYGREIKYTLGNDTLLHQAVDVGGRVSNYAYDFRLMFGGEVGVKINVVTLLMDAITGPIAGAIGSIFGSSEFELYGRVQVQVVMPMNQMEAPGQGVVKIDYEQNTYVYGNCEVEWVLLVPVSVTLSLNMEQRLLATGVDVYLTEDGSPVRRTTYTYDMENAHLPYLGQPFVGQTIENDGRRRTVYNYTPEWKERYRWEDKSVPGTMGLVEVMFPSVFWMKHLLPINTSIEVYDAETGALVETQELEYDTESMRPTRSTVRHGNNYRTLEYAYDGWGNVTYSRDYSVANGRTNQVRSWMYYLNTGFTPSPDVTWRTSPYAQGSVNPQSRNLVAGTVTANTVPQVDGTDSVQYLHSYNHYSSLGQLMGQAQWNGTDWSQTVLEYNPDGSLHRQVNPVGHVTEYGYDQYGLLASVAEKAVCDAAGQSTDLVTRVGHEYISGWKLWEKDPRGYVTQYEYDRLGRVLCITAPDDDDATDWVPTGSVPAFRVNNPVTRVLYDDLSLYSEVINPLGQKVSYDYDALGRMVELAKYARTNGQYAKESVTTLHYDGWGNIISITDPNGNVAGNPDWMHRTQYEYDTMGRNTAVIYPDETETLSDNAKRLMTFDYNNNKKIIFDEEGYKTEEYYDMQGRVVRQVLYNGLEEFEVNSYYDGLGNISIVIDPKGAKTINRYNELNLLEQVNYPADTFWEFDLQVTTSPYTRLMYNNAGQKVKEFISRPGDWEQENEYVLDGLGRIIKTIVKYDEEGEQKEVVTENYYDAKGNTIKIIDANNTLLPKAEQKVLTYSYSAMGLLLTESDPVGNTTSYAYDAIGNRLSMTDARGNSGKYNGDFTISYEYDDLNRLVRGGLPASEGEITNPVVHLNYDAKGNLNERVEPDGGKTTYSYDPRDWVKTITVEGDAKVYTTKYYYDNSGNEVKVIDARGYETTKEYDDLNRNIRTLYPEGNVEQFEYDVNSNQTAYINGNFIRTEYSYDQYNRLIAVKDANNGITFYRYDRWGNMTQMINALGHIEEYQYDDRNRMLEKRDSQGLKTVYRYDAVGNLIRRQNPNGTVSVYDYYPNYLLKKLTLSNGSEKQEQEYIYDECGFIIWAKDGDVVSEYNTYEIPGMNTSEYRPDPYDRIHCMTKKVDEKAFVVEYSYDIMGRVTGVKSPANQWTHYTYNNLSQLVGVPGYINDVPEYDQGGLLTRWKTANGIVASVSNDGNGRLTGLSYQNKIDFLKGYALTYDNAGNIIQKNNDTFRYDALNQLIFAELQGKFENEPEEETQRIGRTLGDYTGMNSMEFSQDQASVIELDYAAGSIGVDLEAQVMVSRVLLTPDSPIHRVNARSLALYCSLDNITYVKVDELAVKIGQMGEMMITLKNPVNARYVKVKSYFDERDSDFQPVNRAQFTNTPEKIIQVYYYVTQRIEEYSYDFTGNRKSETIVQRFSNSRTYKYYPNSNNLMTNEKYGFIYDANGNLIQKGRSYIELGNNIIISEDDECWDYEYDLLDRLIRVSKNGIEVATYTYDEKGLRVKKTEFGRDAYYIFGHNGEILYEEDSQGYSEYIYVLGNHFARVDSMFTSDERVTYFYHVDHLGSTVLITDQDSQTVWRSEYTPFGRRGLEEGILNRAAKFMGKDFDETIGLFYYNARWYDPEIGRFITQDTYRGEMQNPQTLNLFAFVINNPLIYVDPSGNAIKASGWNPPGNQPIPYYLGTEIHRRIGEYYIRKHPNDVVYVNNTPIKTMITDLFPLFTITETPDDKQYNLLGKRPDIVNFGFQGNTGLSPIYGWEIKPISLDIDSALNQIGNYLATLNRHTPSSVKVEPGSMTDPGVSGVVSSPNGVAVFFSPKPGVIIYRNCQKREVEETEEGINTAVEELKAQYAVATLTLGGKVRVNYREVYCAETDSKKYDELYKHYIYKGIKYPYYLTGHFSKYIDPILGTEKVKLDFVSEGYNTEPSMTLFFIPSPSLFMTEFAGELLGAGAGTGSAVMQGGY